MKRQRFVAIYRQYKKPFDAYFLRAPINPLETHDQLSGKLSLLSARVNNRPKAYTAFMPVSGALLRYLKCRCLDFSSTKAAAHLDLSRHIYQGLSIRESPAEIRQFQALTHAKPPKTAQRADMLQFDRTGKRKSRKYTKHNADLH